MKHKVDCKEHLAICQYTLVDGIRRYKAFCPNCGESEPISKERAEAHFAYNRMLNAAIKTE